MEIKGIRTERKLWIRLVIAALSVLIILYEAYIGQLIYVPLGLLVLLACFYRRENVLSPEGVDIRRILFGGISRDLWTWDSIDSIRVDRRRSSPNVTLYISRGVSTRLLLLTPADSRAALELAGEQNPAIRISEIH